MASYSQGDILAVKQGKNTRHYLVVSNADYQQVTGNLIVCKINASTGRFFLQDRLPKGMDTSGNVELANLEVLQLGKRSALDVVDHLSGDDLERILVCIQSFF